jgi:putative membrane protein
MYRKMSAMVVGIVVLCSMAPLFSQQTGKDGERHDFSKVTDEQFAQMAEQINLTEIALGTHAQSKGKRGEVQQFGKQMVTDHTAANKKLATAAKTKLSGALDAKHQSKVDKLKDMSGDAFDRAYMEEMVRGHQMAAALFEHEASHGKDTALKAYAAEILPGVKTHLQKAQQIWKDSFQGSTR